MAMIIFAAIKDAQMIKDIVFDLGGVVGGRDYARYGTELEEFSFLQGDRPFPDYWKHYDLGTASRDEVVDAIARENGLDTEAASEKLDRLMTLFNEFPDTAQLLEELADRNYGLYILSNMPVEFYDYITHFDVFRYFDGQVISSREHLSKPDPRMFSILSNRYGLDPASTLFIDDKPSNTNIATALGFNTYTFKAGRKSCDDIRKILGM